jgi:hypothetical protein
VEINRSLPAFAGLLLLIAACGTTAQTPPQAVISVKGPPIVGVKCSHSAHLEVARKCEVCHHTSKPQKPLKSPEEACTDCHTKPATPPATTGLRAAFHRPAATAGLCITCHQTETSRARQPR